MYILRRESPCLFPQHHSAQGMKVCSVLPSPSLSPPGKTATWPQSRTSSPGTLKMHVETHFYETISHTDGQLMECCAETQSNLPCV